jgi:hypothetical protein
VPPKGQGRWQLTTATSASRRLTLAHRTQIDACCTYLSNQYSHAPTAIDSVHHGHLRGAAASRRKRCNSVDSPRGTVPSLPIRSGSPRPLRRQSEGFPARVSSDCRRAAHRPRLRRLGQRKDRTIDPSIGTGDDDPDPTGSAGEKRGARSAPPDRFALLSGRPSALRRYVSAARNCMQIAITSQFCDVTDVEAATALRS